VAFQKDRIKFDDDLRECSKHCIQVSVEVGMSLGDATQGTGTGKKNGTQGASYAEVVKEG
jgi:hypothetical protein